MSGADGIKAPADSNHALAIGYTAGLLASRFEVVLIDLAGGVHSDTVDVKISGRHYNVTVRPPS